MILILPILSLIIQIKAERVKRDVACTGTADPLEVDESVVTWEGGCTQTCGNGVQIGYFKCVNSISGNEECTADCMSQSVSVRTFQYCNPELCELETPGQGCRYLL